VKSITIQSVDLREEDLAQRIITICALCSNLASLQFYGCEITESLFDILNCAKKLETLQLLDCWDFCRRSDFKAKTSMYKTIQNATLFCQEGYSPVVNTILNLLSPSKLLRLYVCCDTQTEMKNTMQLLQACRRTCHYILSTHITSRYIKPRGSNERNVCNRCEKSNTIANTEYFRL